MWPKTTLLLKFMDKFYNHANVPSISLTWTKLYSTNVRPMQDVQLDPSGGRMCSSYILILHHGNMQTQPR